MTDNLLQNQNLQRQMSLHQFKNSQSVNFGHRFPSPSNRFELEQAN